MSCQKSKTFQFQFVAVTADHNMTFCLAEQEFSNFLIYMVKQYSTALWSLFVMYLSSIQVAAQQQYVPVSVVEQSGRQMLLTVSLLYQPAVSHF
jgi:hypothetical protein